MFFSNEPRLRSLDAHSRIDARGTCRSLPRGLRDPSEGVEGREIIITTTITIIIIITIIITITTIIVITLTFITTGTNAISLVPPDIATTTLQGPGVGSQLHLLPFCWGLTLILIIMLMMILIQIIIIITCSMI